MAAGLRAAGVPGIWAVHSGVSMCALVHVWHVRLRVCVCACARARNFLKALEYFRPALSCCTFPPPSHACRQTMCVCVCVHVCVCVRKRDLP